MVNSSQFDNLPLNHRIIIKTEGDNRQEIPALDAFWVENRPLTKYYPCPVNTSSSLSGETLTQVAANKFSLAVEEWLIDADYFKKDLKWLLQLEFHKFWSEVVNNPKIIQILASFFQEASPCYSPLKTSNEKVKELYHEILRLATMVFCRLVTAKESEVDWMSKEFLGEILYTNYVISVPFLFDVVIALGSQNQMLLSRIVGELFKIQPNYWNDFKSGLEYIQISLQSVSQQVECFQKKEINNQLPSETLGLENLAIYTLDCAVTLKLVLEIVPSAREIAEELKIPLSISSFYDECLPEIFKLIIENSKNQPPTDVLKHLNNARIEFLQSFNGITNFYLENLLSHPSEEIAETIVSILGESMDHSRFVVDYQKHFPVENDFDIIRQSCPEFNVMRLDYIQAGFKTGPAPSEIEDSEEEEEEEIEELQHPTNGFTEMQENIPDSIEEKVKQILDVFPDYGDGYVRKLLKRYEDNPTSVIAAILEGNLPPDLASANTHEPYIPPETNEFFVETGIKRLNIFDGDEFDVMTNDNVKGIHKKGVGEAKHWDAVLNDKSHIQGDVKMRYKELGYIEENHDNEYDDEYDDSYDAMAESEAKTVRFKTARINVMDEIESESEEEEEEPPASAATAGGGGANSQRDRAKDFCENPEVVRARYEQARQAKYGNRNNAPKAEVTGKPKGQGQSEDTQKSRQKKETNKATSGNHNRKKQSSWKQSRGMY